MAQTEDLDIELKNAEIKLSEEILKDPEFQAHVESISTNNKPLGGVNTKKVKEEVSPDDLKFMAAKQVKDMMKY